MAWELIMWPYGWQLLGAIFGTLFSFLFGTLFLAKDKEKASRFYVVSEWCHWCSTSPIGEHFLSNRRAPHALKFEESSWKPPKSILKYISASELLHSTVYRSHTTEATKELHMINIVSFFFFCKVINIVSTKPKK